MDALAKHRIVAAIDKGMALALWLRQCEEQEHAVSRVSEHLVSCLRQGGRILACGNGGSMCDAMHFAEELSGRYRQTRPALAAQALSDPAHLTCVANDWGFEHVFARGVEAWARAGDTLVIFSTSGQSKNVIAAATTARRCRVHVVGLLGGNGGAVASLCDIAIVVPAETSDRVQEIHSKIVHMLVDEVEHQLFPGVCQE